MSPSGPMHTALVASFCCTRMASPLVTLKLSRQDILDRQDTWWRVVEHMVHNGARFYLVQIRGSRPKGNSGRSMEPCLPARGWTMR